MNSVREYRRISTLLDRESSGLSDEERLNLARRLTVLAPKQPDSWWSVATHIDWMLRDIEGAQLHEHPLFPELISAWDTATRLNPKDAGAPYNKACTLSRAGMLADAYEAYMLAGRMEMAHPTIDFEWPASWHFESAADTALALDDAELARKAARTALDASAPDDDVDSLLMRLRRESEEQRPTQQAHPADGQQS